MGGAQYKRIYDVIQHNIWYMGVAQYKRISKLRESDNEYQITNQFHVVNNWLGVLNSLRESTFTKIGLQLLLSVNL